MMDLTTSPTTEDAQADLARHMATFNPTDMTEPRRQEIERNVLGPLILLIESVRLARSSGTKEEEVLFHFIQTMAAQWDYSHRSEGISRLIARLEQLRTPLSQSRPG